MRDSYQSPRRKIGLAALMVACAFAAEWFGSRGHIDSLGSRFSLGNTTLFVFEFPFWLIIIPLTLLSAFIMVCKPIPPAIRKSTAVVSHTRRGETLTREQITLHLDAIHSVWHSRRNRRSRSS